MEYNELGQLRLMKFPSVLNIDGNEIQVVDSFKLLGVTIDSKLNFRKFISDLRLSVNKKMYSIKRLFFLSFHVKLQFLKTFILPYFDYCSSILIYFPKSSVQKISNCYYHSIHKILKIKYSNFNDFNQISNVLEKYNFQALSIVSL